MNDHFQVIKDAVRLEVPADHRVPIAIVGAGGIVDGAHLVAYKKAGLSVDAITDTDINKAKEVAGKYGIPNVYASLEEMIKKSSAQVFDIAVPVAAQPELFAKIAGAGKNILAQKPLATTVEAGVVMADLADQNKIVAAVNQQLRFEEGVAAAHKMVELGWIGTVTNFTVNVNLATPWELWPWAKSMDRLEVMLHSIHYHDMIRWFLGEPKTVFCAVGRTKGQFPKGETRTISTYVYGNGLTGLVHSSHVNRGGDNYAEYRIDGDKGSIRGTFGLLYDYPHGRISTLEINSQVLPTEGWSSYPISTLWFPDAFIGTMGSVMGNLANGAPLRSSVRENIGTLKLVTALYESMENERSVNL
jgi:predicted dehydrogenase